MAYLARYAHQQLPILLGMTVRDLADFEQAVGRIVEQENGPAKGG